MLEDDYNLSELLSPAKTLSDATPEELAQALKQKTSACIMAYIEPCNDGEDVYNAQYGGAWATAIGLSRYFERWIDGKFGPGQGEDE